MVSELALNELTNGDFEPLVNTKFSALNEESKIFELLEVSLLGSALADGQRQAFSLIFRGDNTDSPQQNIYQLHNDAIGVLDVFLVPIGPDELGMRYEAVFT